MRLPAALVGVAAWLFLPVVGRLSLLEATALALTVPCGLILCRDRQGRLLPVLGIVWLVGLGAAAVVHPAPAPVVLTRVAAVVVMVITTALAFSVLRAADGAGRHVLVLAFGAGQAVGLLVSPPEIAALDPWKFGLGQAVTVVLLAAVDRFRGRRGRLMAAVLVPLAAAHLATGSRGLALLTLVVLVGAAVMGASVRRRRPRQSRVRLAAVVLGAAVTAVLVQDAYLHFAAEGRLGASEQIKVRFQAGDFGLVVGGRKDVVFLATAIAQSPLVGWGPAAVPPADVKYDAARWLVAHGYSVSGYDRKVLLSSADLYLHSSVLGSWVTAGVLAVPFWVVAVVLLWRGLLRALAAHSLAESFVLVLALWHVFFSPLGDTTRGHIAIALGLALTSLGRTHPPEHEEPGAPGQQDGHRSDDDRLPAGRPGRTADGGPDRGHRQRDDDAGGHHPGDPLLVAAGLQPGGDRLGEREDPGSGRVRPYGGDGAAVAVTRGQLDQPGCGHHDPADPGQGHRGHEQEGPAY